METQLNNSADRSPRVEQSSVRASATSRRSVACLHLLLLQQRSDDARQEEDASKTQDRTVFHSPLSIHEPASLLLLACFGRRYRRMCLTLCYSSVEQFLRS